jgi:predicted phosphate transport protein (TIGR00153 family)
MLGFVPREKIFFDLLDKLAQVVDRGAQLLCEATTAGFDVAALKDRIKVVEHEGDQITHELILQVTKSFVTPLDREDIHELACRLDDILDLVDAAISRIFLYRVGDLTEDARAMCRNLAQATRVLVKGVSKLRRTRDHPDILPCCIEIHTCENEGDRLEQHALATLFNGAREAADIIKWKDIYDDLESAVDKCEDAANVLETLVLKSS